jgi:hypothetical protein
MYVPSNSEADLFVAHPRGSCPPLPRRLLQARKDGWNREADGKEDAVQEELASHSTAPDEEIFHVAPAAGRKRRGWQGKKGRRKLNILELENATEPARIDCS